MVDAANPGEAGDPGSREVPYDREKYVSYAEYERDVNALRHKRLKISIYIVLGMVLGVTNILVMHQVKVDGMTYWNFRGYDMDYIMAYLAVIFILLIPGIWIGVAKHKLYAIAYFSGFSAAGFFFLFVFEFIIQGIYVFWVSSVLLVVVYIVFFRLWIAVKRSVARPRYE
ncbi:MAG: hypothetical protein ACTSUE_22065 [Promethearchaeota archaeon]